MQTPPPLRLEIETGGYDGLSALLVRLADCAGWSLPAFPLPPRVRWVNLLGAVGILAFFFSVVSPDDAFQQELIRSGTPAVRVPANTRIGPRPSPADLSITAFEEAGDPIQVPRTGHSFVVDQPLEFDAHFLAPTPIQSPPAAS